MPGRGLIALVVAGTVSLVGTVGGSASSPQPPRTRFDVNDISVLWPVPSTETDVAQLISSDEPSASGGGSIWPRAAFDALLNASQEVRVDRGLGQSRITFGQFDQPFREQRTWKVAGFRVDPSAPGGHSGMVKMFGSTPQLRVIFQPVTIEDGRVMVHDFTAHLAFSFIKDTNKPFPGFPRDPDKALFATLIEDLKALKAASEAAGVKTEGLLQVHPALQRRVAGFNDRLKAFLKRHMTDAKLTELAFMGIEDPEPWIFFGMARIGGTFVLTKPKALGGSAAAQMLILRGGPPVLPAPQPTNLTTATGVSTAALFEDSPALAAAAIAGPKAPRLRDIPDLIANPERAHVLNTDCVSCHSESTRRAMLKIAPDGAFAYRRPAGVSGVDAAHLPKTLWNVRNFGWFPDFFKGGVTVATISTRVGNETAEAVDMINKTYLASPPANGVDGATGALGATGGGEPMTAVGTSGESGAQPRSAQPVASPLTLVMDIKSKADHDSLKARIEQMQGLPPDKNPIVQALNQIGTVHFARFVFLSEKQLAVITTYDGSFDTYINAFINAIGPIFDEILRHMQNAPPLPVSQYRKEFLAYIKKHDLTAVPPFYSAYPNLRVLDILELQRKGKSGK